MVSLGKVSFGFGRPQSSDHETVNSQGPPVTHWHLGHSLFQCPGCFLKAHWSQFPFKCPVCSHLAHWFWIPIGLAQSNDPESLASLSWSVSEQGHCHHLGLLCISLDTFSLFGHIPIIENQIRQLEQIAQKVWGPPPSSSCFLNFASEVWGRLGYEMYSQKDLSLWRGGIHIGYYLKASTNLLWKAAGFPSGPCWTSFTFFVIDGFHYKLFHTH